MVVTLGQQYNGEKPTVTLYIYINRRAGTPDKKQKQNRNDVVHIKLGSNNMLLHRLLFKKNMNAPRPSEHLLVRGKISKRLGGIIGCKDKTSSWHLNGFPDGSNIGSTV